VSRSNNSSPSRRAIPCCLAVLLLATLPLIANAQDDDTVRVNSDLVILNVTVTDRSGSYVPGLQAAQFKIYEDGKEVPIDAISSFSLQETPFASVVLLDTSGSMESPLTMAR